LLAAVLDVLDGAVARATGAASEFGGIFDSMADAVSFGVAPVVVVLKTLSAVPGTVMSALLTAAAVTYSVAGVLRLVRFSTSPPSADPELKGVFTGLPITAAATAVISPTLLLMSDQWQAFCPTSDEVRGLVACGVFFLLGYLMVSKWRFPGVKNLNVKISSAQLLVVIASLSSVLLYVSLHNLAAALAITSWGYVLLAWGVAIVRLAQGKRKAALDDRDET
jgi:CDP-diacylglycerol--serine O-phosphatidyltransferase